MNKTTLIAALTLIALLAGILLTSSQPNKPSGPALMAIPSPAVGVVSTNITPIPITPFSRNAQSVRFTAAYRGLSEIPETMTVYRYRNASPDSVAATLATRLGFTGAPTSVSAVGTNVWEWTKTDGSHVSAQTKPLSVSYYSPAAPVPNPPEIQDAQALVKTILDSLAFASPLGIKAETGDFLAATGPNLTSATSRSQANVTSVGFSYTIGGRAFYPRPGEPVSVSGLVVANNRVRSVSIYPPPILEKAGESSLVSMAVAYEALTRGRGVLAWIRHPYPVEASFVQPQITAVTITEAALGYVAVEATSTVEPVWLFSGSVDEGERLTKGSRVMYYVPATVRR